jgi:hypothetical protein
MGIKYVAEGQCDARVDGCASLARVFRIKVESSAWMSVEDKCLLEALKSG